MESPNGLQLLNVALDHARRLMQTLAVQRDDLSRVAPRQQEGADKLARAAQAASGVERALKSTIGRHTAPENQP